MTDLEDLRLDALAPTVDRAKSRAAFDERRRRRRARRRAAIAGGAIGCIAMLALGTWTVARDDRDTTGVVAGPAPGPTTEPGPDVAFEVLAVQASSLKPGVLRAAIDADSYRRLWTSAGLEGDAPPVDFDRQVVVTMTIPDDLCPPTLAGFELDDEEPVLSPRFVEPEGPCREPLIPRTFVVGLDRALVAPMLTVRLPAAASPVYYAGEPSITIVTGTEGPPGLIPPPCVVAGGAQVCLDNPGTIGTVALRATNLLPGSSLAVTLPDGRVEKYPTGQDPIAFFSAPTPGTMRIFHVAGTTASGQPIEGTIAAAG